MPDQADNLREMVRESLVTDATDDAPAACVAVVGSTAGVGATTLLAATARELSSLGQRVLAVDANLARPAVGTSLSLQAAAGLADVLAGRRRLCEATVPAPFGAALLAAPGTPPVTDAGARQRLAAELHAARDRFDVILIDAGVGASPWCDWLCRRAGAMLLVSGARAVDIRAAYSALKSLAGEVPVRLAVNRVADPRTADDVAQRIGETARQFLGRNPLADAPAALPEIADDPLAAAEHRRACRLLAAELMAPLRATLRRFAGTRGATRIASTVAASSLDRTW